MPLSNPWNPLTIAAALRVMLRAFTTSTTGRSSSFAIAAVLPRSERASAPSNSPRTPSMTAISAPRQPWAKTARFSAGLIT